MDKDIHCNMCNYPHVKVRNGVMSITVASVSRDPNTLHERTPVTYDTSLYKDKEVCQLCWRETVLQGSVNPKRVKKEQRVLLKGK